MAEHVHRAGGVQSGNHPLAGVSMFLARLIYFIFGVIIAFVILRMVLLLLGANQGNAFVDFVYGISGVFVAPFYGIFGFTPSFGSSVFDMSSLVAIIVYAMISWGLVTLVTLGNRDHTIEA
jgi:hypothetical protein